MSAPARLPLTAIGLHEAKDGSANEVLDSAAHHPKTERARGLARAHQGDAYLRVFSEFTRQIVDLPRISASEFPVRPFYWSDCLPFGVMRRLFYRGFYRRNDGGFSGS